MQMFWLLSFTCAIFWYSLAAAERAGLEPLFVLRGGGEGGGEGIGGETFGRSVGLVIATALAPLFLGLYVKALFEEQFLSVYDRCDDNLTLVSNTDVVQLVAGGTQVTSLLGGIKGKAAQMRFQPSKQKASALLALTLGIRFMLTMLSHIGLANADVEYLAQAHAEFVGKIKEARANEARRRQLQLSGSSRQMRLARRKKFNASGRNVSGSRGGSRRSERRRRRTRRRTRRARRRSSSNSAQMRRLERSASGSSVLASGRGGGSDRRGRSSSMRRSSSSGGARSGIGGSSSSRSSIVSSGRGRRRPRRHSSMALVSSPGSGVEDSLTVAGDVDDCMDPDFRFSSSSSSVNSEEDLDWSGDSDEDNLSLLDEDDNDGNSENAAAESDADIDAVVEDGEYDFIDDTDILYDEDDEGAVQDAHVSEMTEACVVFLAQLSSIAFAKLRAHAETGIPHAVAGLLRNRQVRGGFSNWLAGELDRVDSTLIPLPDPLEPSGGIAHFCVSSLMVLFATRYFVTPFSLGMFGKSGMTVSRNARSGVLTYMLIRLIVNWLRARTEMEAQRSARALRTPAYGKKSRGGGSAGGVARTTPVRQRVSEEAKSTGGVWFSRWRGGTGNNTEPAAAALPTRVGVRSGRKLGGGGLSPHTPAAAAAFSRRKTGGASSLRMSWMSPNV
jgi:hypothetical protein